MAQGGFKYAEVSLTLDKSRYTNVDQWCLAVHKARCEAFLRASQRWREHYIPIQTNELGEESAEINYDAENTCTVYYNPILNNAGNIPSIGRLSYASFFKHPDTDFEYVIITNNYLSIQDTSYPWVSKLICTPSITSSGSYVAFGYSQNHGCSPAGFDSYNLKNTSVGFYIPVGSYNSTYSGVSSTGVVGRYSSISTGTTFRFGASVKDEVIFAFFFNRNTNKFPFWSVVGKILTEDSPIKYGGLRGGATTTGESEYSSSAMDNYLSNVCITCIRYNNKILSYHNNTTLNSLYSNFGICYSPSITNISSLPEKIPYSAVYGTYVQGGTLNISLEDSIDNNGTLSFLLNPDIVAYTSQAICEKYYCHTICNGNYIIDNPNGDSSINLVRSGGFILGWDPSNPPLI